MDSALCPPLKITNSRDPPCSRQLVIPPFATPKPSNQDHRCPTPSPPKCLFAQPGYMDDRRALVQPRTLIPRPESPPPPCWLPTHYLRTTPPRPVSEPLRLPRQTHTHAHSTFYVVSRQQHTTPDMTSGTTHPGGPTIREKANPKDRADTPLLLLLAGRLAPTFFAPFFSYMFVFCFLRLPPMNWTGGTQDLESSEWGGG
ncbi:hypothetical protein BS50DRAFT_324113 [Corynespora cassiicola Philippines]|uniref:Uncharacterized protein n=1 Tax=Corynespora cassiicola Philippines TaxID=1448308 RepID=A0A2T2NTQ6_CORCC|nr:hypothetical protein BS50DRAFT_324113 [Corynespora cassiicola Philippines]